MSPKLLPEDYFGTRWHHQARGTGEQLFDVLFFLKPGPLVISHLMYKANLNLKVLRELMSFLSAEGFIEVLPDTRIRLTSKGYVTIKAITPFFAFVSRSRELRHKLREAAV